MSKEMEVKHNHLFEGMVSFDDCHCHLIKGCTSYECNKECHKHKIKGETTCEDGHVHKYCIETSYDIPVEGGCHIHKINGKVKEECHHHHHVCLKTSVGIPVVKYKIPDPCKCKVKKCKVC